MRKKERKIAKNASASASQTAEENDQEMQECLEKLKVWRVENLMSPTGMDRFVQDIRTKGPNSAAEKKEDGYKKSGTHPISEGLDTHVYYAGERKRV